LYNNIKQPSYLQPGADFHLFKKGIEPKWEDPRCASGGKWTVTVKGDKGLIDQYWLHAVSPFNPSQNACLLYYIV
jgi:translation initiation factor 4E